LLKGCEIRVLGFKLHFMRIGIDLGGSKIEGLVLDTEGQELARQRMPTPKGDTPEKTYETIISSVAELITSLADEAGADASTPVGVGIPGSVSTTTGKVKNANSTCLIGRVLNYDLKTATARPIRLANDADCFTVSEATDGSGQSYRTVFGVILGTGCGGGISVGGRLLSGPNAIAGEWGHNPLPWPQVLDGFNEWPGPKCYCGKQGCIETFISGPGLERDYSFATDQNLPAEKIVTMLDNEAQAALARYKHRLARALAGVINVLDPDVIVLGGGMSKTVQLYEAVPELWGEWIFSDSIKTKLLPACHGDASGVRGAAWLWQEKSP
jgi:fructokinase